MTKLKLNELTFEEKKQLLKTECEKVRHVFPLSDVIHIVTSGAGRTLKMINEDSHGDKLNEMIEKVREEVVLDNQRKKALSCFHILGYAEGGKLNYARISEWLGTYSGTKKRDLNIYTGEELSKLIVQLEKMHENKTKSARSKMRAVINKAVDEGKVESDSATAKRATSRGRSKKTTATTKKDQDS